MLDRLRSNRTMKLAVRKGDGHGRLSCVRLVAVPITRPAAYRQSVRRLGVFLGSNLMTDRLTMVMCCAPLVVAGVPYLGELPSLANAESGRRAS